MIATLPSSLLALCHSGRRRIRLVHLAVRPASLARIPGVPQWRRRSLEGRSGRGRAVVGAIAFIFGFAIVFVSLGALFGFRGATEGPRARLSIVFGSVTILLGMFFADGGPRGGSTPNDESITCPVSILGAGALGFLFGSDGHRVSVRPRGDPASRDEFGRDRTARFDPRALLLLRTRHPVRRRRVGDRVGVHRLIVATPSPTHDRRIGGVFLIVIGILEVTARGTRSSSGARQLSVGRAIM